MTGFFLSVEGIEGVGKSTAVKFIENYLQQIQKDFIVTREPGGTRIAEKVRQILLANDIDEPMAPETELLLMFASRAQHIKQVISPALTTGKWVVCDRFVDASYAYQGGGRKIDLNNIHFLEKWIVNTVKPDMTILLDAPPAIGLERAKHKGPHDRIEQEKIEFFERVREGYLSRAAQDKQRFHVIDATQSLEVVQDNIIKILTKVLS